MKIKLTTTQKLKLAELTQNPDPQALEAFADVLLEERSGRPGRRPAQQYPRMTARMLARRRRQECSLVAAEHGGTYLDTRTGMLRKEGA